MASERRYMKALERLYDKSADLCDQALRVTLLAVTDNHAEMETFYQKRGPLSMRLLSNRTFRSNSSFWCSDFGQVLDAALVRGDPSRFPAMGCAAAAAARGDPPCQTPTWSLR